MMDDKKFTFSMLKRFSFIPLPLIIATAVIIYIVDIRTIYEPHLLLPILNTIFIGGGGFTIAFIAASAYVFAATRQALFLGGGSLALGISALLAGWIFADSPNVAVTIFSIGALLAAVLHILGATQGTEKYLARYSLKKFPRQLIAILFYSGITIFFVILSVAAIRGFFPPFFVAGEGYTPTRWVITIEYLVLFFTSALFYARSYYLFKKSFLYWYSLGLAIISIGLTLAPLATPGSPLNWLGRISQYLGSIYFLVAAVSVLKEARAKGIGFAQTLGNIWLEPAISYRMLVSMAGDAIISIDDEGKVLVWSPAAERLFGYSQNEAIGSPFASLVAADEQADWLMIRLDRSPDKNRVELELRRKNGETFTAELSVSIADIPSGRLRMVMIRDITERKRTEEELKRAKELSDTLNRINATMNSTLDFDEIMRRIVVEAAKAIGSDACNITLCRNGHWTVAYTYGLPQQVIGIRFTGQQAVISDLVAATKKPLAIKDIRSEERFRHWILQEYGVRSVLGISLLVREEVIGILYFIYFSVKPSFSQAEIDFAEKLSTSISLAIQNARLFEERKRVEEELRQLTAELSRSNAELEQFAYIASHDLQEPLRMISGFTQLLARRYKGKLDKDADEFIAYIIDGVTRMQRMIEDLLAYSRVGTRGKPFESTNLEDVFNQAVTNLKAAIEENKAVITHDPLPTVMADASQMIQLFQNLIANAIKFRKREEPPRIHISARRKGNEWLFSVQDNGIGIASEFMDHLFQLFQRAHPAGEYPGTGIGLATCKRIVERHGGRIWAESEPGKGSTFYFTIPAKGGEKS
ncbi:MAG: ATP-binding protein [Candidatus Methanoperedens sp.]|nr:ATP-binding protein [Candidatus Methanoperedens sp.]